jgi:GntR family transcriptional regulator
MIIEIDSRSEEPIYLQLRKQIIIGIARGELKPKRATADRPPVCR